MPYEEYTDEELIAKYSNGCNGYIPHIWWTIRNKSIPYSYCCDIHDVAYEEGGTEKDRKLADKRFKECLKDYHFPVWAEIQYFFVRVFGRFYFNYNV